MHETILPCFCYYNGSIEMGTLQTKAWPNSSSLFLKYRIHLANLLYTKMLSITIILLDFGSKDNGKIVK